MDMSHTPEVPSLDEFERERTALHDSARRDGVAQRRMVNFGTVGQRMKAAVLVAGLLTIGAAATLLGATQSSYAAPTWLEVALAFGCLGLGATTYFLHAYLSADVVKPLVVAANNAKDLAAGKAAEMEVANLDRTDEIGELARSLNTVRKAAFKFQALRKASEAERNDHLEALKRLTDKFDRTVGEIVGSVASASSELQATAAAMATSAEQSSEQSQKVSSALVEASAGVTAAAAASDEFAMSIGEISRQASSSAELARKASTAAIDADETISELTESAAKVGKVVELISTIAQRTNLLALNASIEAARGGEAGRGFAVVATEVKELATQTGKATEQVAAQIRTMQDTTTASVTALRDIAEQIKQLETSAVSIAAAVDQQSVAGQDLARSIDLAARSAEEVSSNIAQVRESSLATGSAASQVLSSSTALETQATMLKAKASDFIQHIREA